MKRSSIAGLLPGVFPPSRSCLRSLTTVLGSVVSPFFLLCSGGSQHGLTWSFASFADRFGFVGRMRRRFSATTDRTRYPARETGTHSAVGCSEGADPSGAVCHLSRDHHVASRWTPTAGGPPRERVPDLPCGPIMAMATECPVMPRSDRPAGPVTCGVSGVDHGRRLVAPRSRGWSGRLWWGLELPDPTDGATGE